MGLRVDEHLKLPMPTCHVPVWCCVQDHELAKGLGLCIGTIGYRML